MPCLLFIRGNAAAKTTTVIGSIAQEGKRRAKALLSVSTKWLCHFVEFAFFTVSEADGREKWKEWFRLWPKPSRPTGIAGRYESSQRGMMPLRHLLIGFVDSLRRAKALHSPSCHQAVSFFQSRNSSRIFTPKSRAMARRPSSEMVCRMPWPQLMARM